MEIVTPRKKMIGLTWCIVIFAVVGTSVSAFDCSEVHTCSCHSYIGDSFKITCDSKNNSAFGVYIHPSRSIQVECTNSPKWSDFPVNIASLGRSPMETMSFKMCDLPPSNLSLGKITQMLGVVGVEKLVFRSFRNLSSKLTQQHLDGFDNLRHLFLSNNMISYLDKDLLANLPTLTELNLMENNIILPAEFFDHTPKLERLELGGNSLLSIEPGVFDNLKKLKMLNLWKNNLSEFPPKIFDKLVALKSLDINTNNFVTLPKDIFAKLENLEVINLSRNYFTSLPADLLRNNTKLDTVTISYNRAELTTLPSEFFGNFTKLRVLRLKGNRLVELPEDLFRGSFSLTNISLTNNRLRSLPQRIFQDAKQLLSLELDKNELEELPDYIFATTNRLLNLNLSKNRITTITTNMFSGLYQLRELNMQNNLLTTISHKSLSPMRSLRIARFSNNHLTLLSNYLDMHEQQSPFRDCSLLEELYLANNNIPVIFKDWMFNTLKLRILDLQYNNISILRDTDLQFLSNNLRINLTYNNIQHVFLNNAELISSTQDTPRDVIITIENNPIICDCYIYGFLRYIEGKMHPYVQNYFHIIYESVDRKYGDLTCGGPQSMESIRVADLRSETLKCMIKDTNLNISCPQECDCILRPENKAVIIDCSNRNLTQFPSDIKDPGKPFQFELNFSGNMLKKMPNLTKLKLQSVKVINLSQNNISEVFLDGLPDEAQVLELHNNNISRIHPDVLEFLKNSTNLTLTLHENPWECDCEAKDFLDFVQTRYAKIADISEVMCRGENYSMSRMTVNDFCPSKTELFIGISVVIAFIGIFVGIFGFYYRYQRNIKVWLFARQWCLWFVTEEELDKEKLYDAFISYSHRDQNFVQNELVSKLENGPKPFKLCLHYRDWLAGEWIPTQIAKSVEDSRRTIVVLSPNFLESVWGRMEFRAAHSQALSEGRARVILILYGDIGPTDDMDPELKAYISMNTYVKWGDPWFWDKLRYALPHPPKSASAAGRKIYENHQLCMQMEGDKKELIYPIGPPETPLANTTPPADTLKTFICDEKLSSNIEYSHESLKSNGDIAVIFEPKPSVTQEFKIAAFDNRQCTTVC